MVSDKGRISSRPEKTNAAFVLKGPQLDIMTANAEYYHGYRAYFDGRYFKAASLDAAERDPAVRAGEAGISEAE